MWLDSVYHQTFTEQPQFVSYPTFPNTLLLRGMARRVSTPERQGMKFHEGILNTDQLKMWFPKGELLVLDDLMPEVEKDKRVLDLFTKHSHHQNVIAVYLCQDMLPRH